MPVYLPALPSSTLTDTIGWFVIDRFGIERDLNWSNSNQVFVPKGTKGLGYADVNLSVEKRPFSRGSSVRHIATQPVEISLPLVINMPTHKQLLQKVEEVRNWFHTGDEHGLRPAYLKVRRPQDGTTRQIRFFYNGGLGGDLEEGSPTFAPFVVKLFCPDADWLDAIEQQFTFTQANLIGPTVTVTNLGDVSAYPIFTWNGPGYDALLKNLTTGKQIYFHANGGLPLALGETVIIDTRPATDRANLPVINTAGVSLFRWVDPSSDLNLWLEPGLNNLQFTVQDTTSSSSIGMRFLQRYRGVLR